MRVLLSPQKTASVRPIFLRSLRKWDARRVWFCRLLLFLRNVSWGTFGKKGTSESVLWIFGLVEFRE